MWVAEPCHTDKLCLSSVLDIETISQTKKEVQGDMSYAIVRNEKLTRAEVNGKGTHNDRKAKNHTNKDINPTKEYQEKSYNLEYEYKYKVRKLEKENSKLHKIIDKFYETIDKFIHWICVKFDIAEEDNLIRDFQKETNTFLNPEKQIRHEEIEKEWNLER